ncbi:MAG: FtsX-like permease family protein [Firmicutes bacterium]|nr:FtsX-like permease family protein [Bacillota bacterium]
MNLLEMLKLALTSIKASKLRTLLTTLGITIGIAAVISVVAIGQGGKAALNTEIDKLGANIFAVWVKGETRAGDMQMSDIQVIKASVPEVRYLAPLSSTSMKVRGPRGQEDLSINGTTPEMAGIRNLVMNQGRFLNSEDQATGRRVVVLGEDTAKKLFGASDPVGRQVSLDGNSAMVIGIVKNIRSSLGDSEEPAYVPISFLNSLQGSEFIYLFYGSATSRDTVSEAVDGTVKVLERRHQLPKHYQGETMESAKEEVNKMLDIVSLIISSIAGISLLVSGIGVMNIMLVSVTERTREVGIRMALGACRRDILVQFLVEAVVLCLIGGALGTLLGYGGATLVAVLADWPPLVSWGTVVLAFGFSAAIGLFFGIYPANRAAKLNPIEALRRE